MIFSYFGSEWEEDGLCWKQEVSCSPSLRKDVMTVRSELDNLLVERQARDTGICQVSLCGVMDYFLVLGSGSELGNFNKNIIIFPIKRSLLCYFLVLVNTSETS